MVGNDCHVIVHMILVYLNDCLKNGENTDLRLLTPDALEITENKFRCIFMYLVRTQYIKNFDILTDGRTQLTNNIQISPKGIQYLYEISIYQ